MQGTRRSECLLQQQAHGMAVPAASHGGSVTLAVMCMHAGLAGRALRGARHTHALELSCPDIPEDLWPQLQALGCFGGRA